MRTLAQARKDRRQLLRDLKKAETLRHKAKVQQLRDEEKRAKEKAREDLKLARALCKENAINAREVADRAYADARAKALEARRARKRAASEGCSLSKAYIRRCAEEKAARARAEREEAIRFRAELARIEAANRSKGRALRTSSKLKRSESDDEVEGNIPDRLVPLWKRVKRSMRATDRMSRTEAFLHYAEENPGEATDAQEAAAEKSFKRELSERYAEERRERAAAVPF